MAEMNDDEILKQISGYVDEEHHLWNRSEAQGELSPDERQRLDRLKVALDQCWDLLDQRRALRGVGRNPNEAHLRDPATVENYQQ